MHLQQVRNQKKVRQNVETADNEEDHSETRKTFMTFFSNIFWHDRFITNLIFIINEEKNLF